jgi:hypothetical protein
MSRCWAASAPCSYASVIFCLSGVTGACPGLISITGRLELVKLLSIATGFDSGSPGDGGQPGCPGAGTGAPPRAGDASATASRRRGSCPR